MTVKERLTEIATQLDAIQSRLSPLQKDVKTLTEHVLKDTQRISAIETYLDSIRKSGL